MAADIRPLRDGAADGRDAAQKLSLLINTAGEEAAIHDENLARHKTGRV